MLKKLYIRYKIWKLESEIDSIYNDIMYYKVYLISNNTKFFDGKLNINDRFNEYCKLKLARREELKIKINHLKEKLKA
jgi:hypothetical protein